MKNLLHLLNVVFLLTVQLVTAIALVAGWHWGSVQESYIFLFFIGINLPFIFIGANKPASNKFGCFLIFAMAIIALNFFRAALTIGYFHRDFNDVVGLLHILSAQSLWVAFPAYWMSRDSRISY